MKGRNKYRRILLLMITSQLLLTLFVLQWLRSQYRSEKERLVNELTGFYIDTQDEIVDTILFRSFVGPALSGTSQPGITHMVTLSDSGKHDDIILRSVKLIVSHTRDSLKIRGTEIPDPAINPDTAVFRQHFQNRLDTADMDFHLTWVGSSGSTGEKNIKPSLYIKPLNPFALPAVSVTRYGAYLTGEIFPQILFGLILVFVTALAFSLSYRSIRDHITLNEMRNEFISNMTHELKTPVATLSIALESLGKYNMRKDPRVIEEYLKLASQETKRLEDLINRVLDHSMLEEETRTLNISTIDINMLISEVADTMRVKLEEGGKIEFMPSPELITVNGDPLFLRGVLLNLIDNSIKYCDKVPVIRILSAKVSGFAVVEVNDNGPGIPAEYHKKIFEKFFRLPAGNVHNVKGYGLGLSFVSLVMKLHKGSIEFRNCDNGCSFILKIPVA
jgi:signal transduction histidine kinase